jgi:GNAT superfamily N-acetyltransferase
MPITVMLEDARTAASQQLIAELSAELGERYGDDGSALFKPEDVMIPRAAFVVARLDDEPVGCGALRPMYHDTTIAEIKRMYVRPAARGKGISRQILAKLEALAAENGYSAVQLETGTLQHEAIGLYESSGFGRIPCYGPYVDDPMSICYGKRVNTV